MQTQHHLRNAKKEYLNLPPPGLSKSDNSSGGRSMLQSKLIPEWAVGSSMEWRTMDLQNSHSIRQRCMVETYEPLRRLPLDKCGLTYEPKWKQKGREGRGEHLRPSKGQVNELGHGGYSLPAFGFEGNGMVSKRFTRASQPPPRPLCCMEWGWIGTKVFPSASTRELILHYERRCLDVQLIHASREQRYNRGWVYLLR